MGLKLAFKAFMKAYHQPEKAEEFLKEPEAKQIESVEPTHLRLLYHLQQSGRLIDFLKEDITSFSDAQVGAVVRKIHADCAKLVEDLITVRPLRDEQEGASIQILKGYDPSEIKIVGNVKGEPPFSGILVHRGWKAHKRSLPKKMGEMNQDVICPAEVEIK
ncbi:MAG: DUF2760 domain-containing protein [Parachlamydia sp.]|jgi:hypothetical protein|nr:DUF2760 domain-containing protein [Parachlamydia sp.]